ncbi:putative carbohydrate kinase [Streptomyces sp. HCCB10043]|nr:putative carbohydrate kinase [Streptomyces sp. HCCB10043]
MRPRPLLTSLARAYGRPAAQEFSPALRLLDTSAHWSSSPHGPCRTAV